MHNKKYYRFNSMLDITLWRKNCNHSNYGDHKGKQMDKFSKKFAMEESYKITVQDLAFCNMLFVASYRGIEACVNNKYTCYLWIMCSLKEIKIISLPVNMRKRNPSTICSLVKARFQAFLGLVCDVLTM